MHVKIAFFRDYYSLAIEGAIQFYSRQTIEERSVIKQRNSQNLHVR